MSGFKSFTVVNLLPRNHTCGLFKMLVLFGTSSALNDFSVSLLCYMRIAIVLARILNCILCLLNVAFIPSTTGSRLDAALVSHSQQELKNAFGA